jgi:putative ABC transport system ATP-binding protein
LDGFITLKDVKKTYKVGDLEIHAVNGVSFSIAKGDFAIVAGASGAGKSTVLNLIGGMDTVTSGHLHVDGKEITGLGAKQLTTYRRNDIGFVFQFYNLVPNLNALENVELATEICKDHFDPQTVLVRWPKTRNCCSATSRQARWTMRRASRSSSCCRTPAGIPA